MTKSKIFFYTCLFFILGVFLGTIFTADLYFYAFILSLSFFCALIGFKWREFLIFALFGLVLTLGILRYQLSLPVSTSDKIFFYNGQNMELRGAIYEEPDTRQDGVKLKIKVEEILQNNIWQKISGNILVTNYLYPEYKYGDYLQIKCKLQKPENINGFSYDNYLARYDIYSICYYPKIILLGNKGNFFLARIYDFKNFFVSRLNRILPEPQSSFLAGLLIGAKKSIPPDLQLDFTKTGTTHIVAVSGFNVTIVVTFIMLLLNTFSVPRKRVFWLTTSGLILFVIITGLQASILRAAIMGFLVLIAGYLGRLSRVINGLLLAAAVMLILNPKLLVYDLGFQLSFLATLGLIYLQPILSALFRADSIKNKFFQSVVGDYLATTLGAIIMTTPIILFNFGRVSLVAPLANILILPVIPLSMLLGFLAGIFGLFSILVGSVAAWPVWLILTYIIWVLEKLAGLNWAYFEFSKIGFLLMFGLYFLIVLCIYLFNRIARKKQNF